MKKRQLIEAVVAATGLSWGQAEAAVDALFGVPNGIIVQALQAGRRVQIYGFGTFYTRQRMAHIGRNPKTGDVINIPSQVVPTLKVARSFMEHPSGGRSRKGREGLASHSDTTRRRRVRIRGEHAGRDDLGSPPLKPTVPKSSESAREPASDGTFDFGPQRLVRAGRRPRRKHVADREPTREEVRERIPTTLSVQGPKEIDLNQESEIRVRIELAAEAQPFEHWIDVLTAPAEPIYVSVRVEGEAVQLVDPPMKIAAPPRPGTPSEATFAIRGRARGVGTVVVDFQQGSTVLAALTLAVTTKEGGARDESQTAEAKAAKGDVDDRAVLRVLVQPPNGSNAFYTFLVTSKVLELFNAKFTSRPFELGPSQASDAPLNFARSVYKRIESEVLERQEDAELLDERLKNIGVGLCRQLWPDELVRCMWDKRGEIDAIEINSFEPYIPWEMLRLRHPDLRGSAATDGRHVAEYRMVRTLSGRRWPAESLGREDWCYVLANYPHDSYPALTGEQQFFANHMQDLGVEATSIPPTPLKVLDALNSANFDVIHFACHGLASLDDIDASALIIGDRMTAGGTPAPLRIFPTDLVDANLDGRKPLVFLNACQSGRMGPSLTEFGGWPRALFDAGAGAYVGTSWSVHEGPAVQFAKSFYDTLLSGKTLAEAGGAARAAIKGEKGASWLSYAVYGLPSARMRS